MEVSFSLDLPRVVSLSAPLPRNSSCNEFSSITRSAEPDSSVCQVLVRFVRFEQSSCHCQSVVSWYGTLICICCCSYRVAKNAASARNQGFSLFFVITPLRTLRSVEPGRGSCVRITSDAARTSRERTLIRVCAMPLPLPPTNPSVPEMASTDDAKYFPTLRYPSPVFVFRYGPVREIPIPFGTLSPSWPIMDFECGSKGHLCVWYTNNRYTPHSPWVIKQRFRRVYYIFECPCGGGLQLNVHTYTTNLLGLVPAATLIPV